MKVAMVVASALLIVTAVVGTVVAILGNTDAALLTWIAGGVVSASIVFLTPWLIHFFRRDSADDDVSI